MKLNKLGDSIVMNLRFKTDEGISSDDMKVGQWVVIFGEIPARKLKNGLFVVYPNGNASKVESNRCTERKLYKPEIELAFEEPKYINGKRNHSWSRASYF